MADSVKTQIVNRVMALMEELKTTKKVRVCERRKALVASTPNVRPALYVVFGEESVKDQDSQGYTLTMPLNFQLQIEDARDPYGASDVLEALIQAKIESDPQLANTDGDGLCNAVTYEGCTPFTNEVNKPEGGTVLIYELEWRRKLGAPAVNY